LYPVWIVWIGYKNPCMWIKGMEKFSVLTISRK
jgi:hypothetical protein